MAHVIANIGYKDLSTQSAVCGRHAAVQRAIMAALPTLRSVAAADTCEALDLCLQTRFDLVVAHENAGELSGWDLLSALETTHYHPAVPAILVIEDRLPTPNGSSTGDVLVMSESEISSAAAQPAIHNLLRAITHSAPA
ncbi:hypothetical protein GH975_03445 [Litorivicinus lipolyticus]|uniref:Uncharacterized protein n=1 Tax=Litorivicinus lipolyticus TaxID=418701 RepID=A0A5Q2QBM0_9GAMM|nr:hypothetical protein [Litorivicinus lipolyticus]QGG79672.1 hypothetical protein GH975_03445 [Litorivicinus lipolyticus]